jgi:hypothetical protein
MAHPQSAAEEDHQETVGNCEYTKQIVVVSQKGVVLQHGIGLGAYNSPP